ncbi:MAG: NifU family protein [Dysosmobacter welbionis]
MREEWKQIEAVLDEKVRPSLRAHGGELEIDHLEGGVLYIRLLGQCAGCLADLTNETLMSMS